MTTPKPAIIIDALFKAFTDASSDIIHLNDEQGNILYANQASEKLLGYSEQELLHTPAFALIHEDDQPLIGQDMEAIRPDKTLPAREIRLRKKDGSYLPVEVQGFLVPSQERRLIGAVIRDISTRRAREQQRQQLNKKKLESVGVLAGGIAHDFNNLLSIIMGAVDLAQYHTGAEGPIRPLLEKAKNACQCSTKLTSQLLTFARGGSPRKQAVDLAPLIDQCLQLNIQQGTISCQTLLADDLWPVMGDADQLYQVIQNLVVNGCQAMEQGGTLRISAKNSIHAGSGLMEPGRYLQLEICDEGCGIKPEHLEQIFDPYFSTKRQSSSKGNGLGLAITYSIINKHGGDIQVSSDVGQGSCFTLHLPAGEVVVKEASQTKVPQATGQRSGKILVLDDEQDILDIYQQALGQLGYTMVGVTDGAEAVQRYVACLQQGQQPFSAVIVDIIIPGGMGGEEAARQLLGHDPQAVLIVSSGYANSPTMTDATRLGFSAVLPKPVEINALDQVLLQALAKVS